MALHSKLTCKTCAASPVARFESAVAVAQSKMFIIGGHMEPDLIASRDVLAYNPMRDHWERRKHAPRALSHLTAAVSDDRYVWLVGGYEGQHPGVGVRSTLRYDAVDDHWDDGPPLPQIRASGGLALVGRQLHYYGGLDADRCTNRSDHWILEIDRPDRWRSAADAPLARTHAATAVLNDEIYAIGGHFGHDTPGQPGTIAPEKDLDWVHRYLPNEDRWEEVAPLSRRRSHCEPGTFVLDGRIVCIGGRNNDPGGLLQIDRTPIHNLVRRFRRKVEAKLGLWKPGSTLDDVIAYDPIRDRWEDIGRLPKPLYAPAAASIDGAIFVTNGGQQGWQNPMDSTYRLEL